MHLFRPKGCPASGEDKISTLVSCRYTTYTVVDFKLKNLCIKIHIHSVKGVELVQNYVLGNITHTVLVFIGSIFEADMFDEADLPRAFFQDGSPHVAERRSADTRSF